jgi:uncharacterized protein YjbI with pentapeptide repeats
MLALALLVFLRADWEFQRLNLRYGAFRSHTLRSRVYRRAYWPRGHLEGYDLSYTDLSNGVFWDTSFDGARLARAKLSGCRLFGATFTHSDLSNADLRRAKLGQADFTGAILRGADLQCADLARATLRGADLTGAELRGADLNWALYNSETRWPSGFDPDSAGCKAD